jgi:hypothetical protein
MTLETKASPETPPANDDTGKAGASTAPARKRSVTRSLFRHWRLSGFVLLALFAAGTYLWKDMAVKRAQAAVAERAAGAMSEQARAGLRLAALPLVWAVRSEMISGNMYQVKEYLNQFVREPNMKELAVASADGSIVAATDKKREGTPAADSFPEDALKADTISASLDKDGNILVVAPVMGLNARLGTLIILSSPPVFALEKPAR